MKDEHKGAIEVSVIFHEGQRMFAVPKYPAPVQEPVAWMDASGDIYKHELWPDWNPPHTPLYTTPPAQPAPVQGPDWKAEYLKSVESGCITLDELRETLAELEATNRQVEILSDALAESRREVAARRQWVGSGDLEDSNAYQTPPAQPAVPDAITDRSESPEYIQGWNDCRADMLKGMKP
jgi:hypothetical protein